MTEYWMCANVEEALEMEREETQQMSDDESVCPMCRAEFDEMTTLVCLECLETLHQLELEEEWEIFTE